MAAILTRLLGTSQKKITIKSYPDVKTTHWAAAGIQVMKDTGMMKTYPQDGGVPLNYNDTATVY